MSGGPDGEARSPIPAGWRLVPEKATPEMARVAARLMAENVPFDEVYAALLASAPVAPLLVHHARHREALEKIGALREREFVGGDICGPGEKPHWVERPTRVARMALSALAYPDAPASANDE